MATIPWLEGGELDFPPLEQALDEPDGLLAVGGDLSPERLLHAYRQGIFPWYEDPHPIFWWSPAVRAVITPGTLHVSRSLRRSLRRQPWQVSRDQAFDAVVVACAQLDQQRPGTWITAEMRAAYNRLHQLGWAHSVEVWLEGVLVGGLYGVAIGGAFFGESMFSRVSDASKIALLHLDRYLHDREFGMLDCQMMTPHLASMGARPLPRPRFARQLAREVTRSCPETSGAWPRPIAGLDEPLHGRTPGNDATEGGTGRDRAGQSQGLRHTPP